MTPETKPEIHETTAQTTMQVREQNVIKIGNKKIHFQATGITKSIHQQLDLLAEEAKGVINSYYMFVNEHEKKHRDRTKITVRLQYKNYVLTIAWRQIVVVKRGTSRYAKHIPKTLRQRKFKDLTSGEELEKLLQTDAQLENIRKMAKALHVILRNVSHYSDLWVGYDKVTHEN